MNKENKILEKIRTDGKCITARRPKTGEIEEVCVLGESWIKKEEIIKRINNGENFNVKGTNVNVVDNRYLRTDKNEHEEDNLGKLSDNCDC